MNYSSQRAKDRQIKRNSGWLGTPIPPNGMVLQGNPIKCAEHPPTPPPCRCHHHRSPGPMLHRRISSVLPTPWREAPLENCLASTPAPSRLGLAAPLPTLTPVGPSPPAFPSGHRATQAWTSSTPCPGPPPLCGRSQHLPPPTASLGPLSNHPGLFLRGCMHTHGGGVGGMGVLSPRALPTFWAGFGWSTPWRVKLRGRTHPQVPTDSQLRLVGVGP